SWSHSEARPGPAQPSAVALRVRSMAASVVADLPAQPHRLGAEGYPSRTGTLIAAALVEVEVAALPRWIRLTRRAAVAPLRREGAAGAVRAVPGRIACRSSPPPVGRSKVVAPVQRLHPTRAPADVHQRAPREVSAHRSGTPPGAPAACACVRRAL